DAHAHLVAGAHRPHTRLVHRGMHLDGVHLRERHDRRSDITNSPGPWIGSETSPASAERSSAYGRFSSAWLKALSAWCTCAWPAPTWARDTSAAARAASTCCAVVASLLRSSCWRR